ncbi:MAG: hypothetical protein JST08_01040 [Actinobacteria bacterium]|nr:hypothetical protein [Actinomycetota bacterium]
MPGDSAIVPLIVGGTSVAIEASRRLLDEGVFVTGFGYPVVPEGTARIRARISAAHTEGPADALATALTRGGAGAHAASGCACLPPALLPRAGDREGAAGVLDVDEEPLAVGAVAGA